MRTLLISTLLTATAVGQPPPDRTPRPEVDRVAAFARLYGVVRYFYPSDAAADADWDRLAVEGVKRARAAGDGKSLEAVLEQLFQLLGPGIEIGGTLPPPPPPASSEERLVAWRYFGAGFDRANVPGPYRGKRTNRTAPGATGIDGFVTLMQNVAAAPLAGKHIRLRGHVRASAKGAPGGAALWLRVDRGDSGPGFFDNMGDRPIREPAWRQYEIEGPVADDATNVAFGIMASGAVSADFDGIELSVRGADGGWIVVPIRDGGFEESARDNPGGWFRAGTSKMAQVGRAADGPAEGRQFARLSAPPPPDPNTPAPELFDDAPPRAGDHVDIDLGVGLKARVPLALTDRAASEAAVKTTAAAAGAQDVDTRLGDVVVAWNVLRHFYPYWSEAGVDWDAKLRDHLAAAYAASSREEHRNALRRLVADARDGHGGVIDMRQGQPRAALPLRLRRIEGQLVVTASGAPSDVPVGAVVSTIDGVPSAERLEAAMRLASGTTQWRESRALQELTSCARDSTVTLVADARGGSRSTTLPCDAKQPPAERRPEPIAELSSGVWYVDLTRARTADITPRFPALAAAPGVVFDLRGYPTDAGAQILPHFLDKAETDRWMHVAKIVGPFGRVAGWQSFGWNLGPVTPRFTGRMVFMTDGRAISYAESVIGYIADRKLATIVGSPTAGANGNVVAFTVPGGFRITFTGMRVTGHDGQAQHHLVGITPDVPLEPTIAGVRAGRDDVLERALAIASTGRR